MDTLEVLTGMESRYTRLNKQIRMAGLIGNDRITKLTKQFETAGLLPRYSVDAALPRKQTGVAAVAAKVMQNMLPRCGVAIDSAFVPPGVASTVTRAMEQDRLGGIDSAFTAPGIGATLPKSLLGFEAGLGRTGVARCASTYSDQPARRPAVLVRVFVGRGSLVRQVAGRSVSALLRDCGRVVGVVRRLGEQEDVLVRFRRAVGYRFRHWVGLRPDDV